MQWALQGRELLSTAAKVAWVLQFYPPRLVCLSPGLRLRATRDRPFPSGPTPSGVIRAEEVRRLCL